LNPSKTGPTSKTDAFSRENPGVGDYAVAGGSATLRVLTDIGSGPFAVEFEAPERYFRGSRGLAGAV
jgi:hypothetical protein